jgi:hypothetical protein
MSADDPVATVIYVGALTLRANSDRASGARVPSPPPSGERVRERGGSLLERKICTGRRRRIS